MTDVITATLQLKFESDWHVGSGQEEPGGDDRLVCRDADDLPYVPAKTLTAMLRDTAERIAIGTELESTENATSLKRWVLWIFGDQPTRDEFLRHDRIHEARLSVRSAHFPRSIRDLLRPPARGQSAERMKRQELRDALVFSKASVKIGLNGQALNSHLRYDQMARGSVILVSENLSLDLSDLDGDQTAFVKHFLVAIVATTERLGAKRRRGAGRVAITMNCDGLQDAAAAGKFFEKLTKVPVVPCDGGAADQTLEAVHNDPANAASAWTNLPFTLTAETPLRMTKQTIGNVTRTLDYVPGTMLLPIVAKALRKVGMLANDVHQLIATSDLRVSNATLAFMSGGNAIPGLPVPAAWFQGKGDQSSMTRIDGASCRFEEHGTDHEQTHPKACREGYLGVVGAGNQRAPFATVRKVVIPHNTVAEAEQRPTTEVGGVFSNEAIEARTVLCGEIMLRGIDDATIEALRAELASTHRLGRAKKDAYGLVRMTVAGTGGPQHAGGVTGNLADQTITLWLTSDMILRESNLKSAPTQATLVAAIAGSLGLQAGDLICKDQLEQPHAFLRFRRLESWQVGWGLPRPSIVAIAAGSCIRLTIKSGVHVTADALKKLEVDGLGERRAEGFGRLLINDANVTTAISTQAVSTATLAAWAEAVPNNAADDGADTFFRINQVIWKRYIRKEATRLAKANYLGLDPKSSKPPASQMGIVRGLLRQLGPPGTNQSIVDRLEALTTVRAEKWPGNTLSDIIDMVSENNLQTVTVWTNLGSASWPGVNVTSQEFSELKDQFWAEAVRVLIETCFKVHQRNRESNRPAEVLRVP